jgi:hypothetical protein
VEKGYFNNIKIRSFDDLKERIDKDTYKKEVCKKAGHY